jgi:hypothetical protein
VGTGAVAVVAVTAVVGQRLGMFSRVPPSRPFEAITLKKLTDTGKVVAVAMSPDGRSVTAMEWRDLKSCARAVCITRIQMSLLCR